MRARRAICYALTVVALGAICMAQSNAGNGSQTDQQQQNTQTMKDQQQQNAAGSMSSNVSRNDNGAGARYNNADNYNDCNRALCNHDPQTQTRINNEEKRTKALQDQGSQ